MPLVSVIVPNYNHAPYLEQRLDSIIHQSFDDFELILLDDASTDNSVEILSRYAKHPKVSHFIVNTSNSKNTFIQWKKGLDLASGEYIWIAESDDFAEAEFLEKLVHLHKHHPDTGLFFCRPHNVDKEGRSLAEPTRAEKLLEPVIWNEDFVQPGTTYLQYFLPNLGVVQNTSGVLFKKKWGLKFIDVILPYYKVGDYLFWILFFAHCPIGFSREQLNTIRRSSSNVGKTNYALIKEIQMLKIHYYVLSRYKLPFATKKETFMYHLKWISQGKNLKKIFSAVFSPSH